MKAYFDELATKYNVPVENVLSIALNRYGVKTNDFLDQRVRFSLNFSNSDLESFFALGVNTCLSSPFLLKGDLLYLEDTVIGKITKLEKDTCTSTYFRNNKKAITFNSNSRSKCAGCKFCGTYNLTDDDNIDFSTKQKVKDYFSNLLEENQIPGMNNIENVTICTGCFPSEDDLIKHLLLVNDAFLEMGFSGSLNYIGSQLRNKDKIKGLVNHISDFGIYLTLEKFLDREKFMRPEKASLTLEKAKDLLEYCSSLNITTTFLYILGLESLDAVYYYFNYFKDSINKFPIVQVFQNYTLEQENYRYEDAKNIEYYLKAREMIDSIFSDKKLTFKSWECFRGLHFDKSALERKLKK